MTNQGRMFRVLIALVTAMSVGAVVLMALDGQSLSGGAFSLASYRHLNPVEDVALRPIITNTPNWRKIDVHYSQTSAGGVEHLAALKGPNGQSLTDTHFVICNGNGEKDGLIQPTQRWLRQQLTLPGNGGYSGDATIRVCIIGDGLNTRPTDSQTKRTAALVELLSRRFDIPAGSISYPLIWRM